MQSDYKWALNFTIYSSRTQFSHSVSKMSPADAKIQIEKKNIKGCPKYCFSLSISQIENIQIQNSASKWNWAKYSPGPSYNDRKFTSNEKNNNNKIGSDQRINKNSCREMKSVNSFRRREKNMRRQIAYCFLGERANALMKSSVAWNFDETSELKTIAKTWR